MPENAQTEDADGVENLRVVGIGASAGGLAAFRALLENLSSHTGMAFVIVQHLSPERKSELASLLDQYSAMPVSLISESTPLQPNHIYVNPPDASLTLEGDFLKLGDLKTSKHHHVSIDYFFQSLAETKREDATGIILSGTQRDGARGVVSIKDRGGITIAQAPEEAQFDSMPRAAIDTGRIDLVLSAEEIGRRLSAYATNRDSEWFEEVDENGSSDDFESNYRAILARLHTSTGHDFTNYKRSTILRRMGRRLQLHGLADLSEYRSFIESNPDEVQTLFDEILITVTSFFRNPEAFEALRDKVISRLFAERRGDRPIRIWVPGCATGEEVYSIAILVHEEAKRRDVYPDFKIFATDLDRNAIEHARRGLYSTASTESISEALLERYFNAEAGGFRVSRELRDRVLFAVHNVLRDPPFARQDLISCRNLLIYLDRQAQTRVFEVLHYALCADGRLFLGNSEFLGDAQELFTPVDKKNRIYRPSPVDRPILPHSEMGDLSTRMTTTPQRETTSQLRAPAAALLERRHFELLSENYGPPSVLVDRNYEILHVSGDPRDYLRIPRGQPTSNLLKAAHPDLRLALRAALIDAFDKRESTTTGDLKVHDDDRRHIVRLVVRPLDEPLFDDREIAQVSFEPSSPMADESPETVIDFSEADPSLRKAVRQLEEETESLKVELHDTIERYETTTEELKTSNEELLTINEELQSTTEELETSQEELQSTNEELMIVNDELASKVRALDEVNSDLKNLFASTQIGTIFLDRQLQITRFTEVIKKYFNLLDTDIGRPLAHITHQLDYDALLEDARQVLENLVPIEREVKCLEGGWFIVRMLPYRTIQDRIDGVVLTFYDITERKQIQEEILERETLFRTLFENASDSLYLFRLDEQQRPMPFLETNASACARLGYSHRDLETLALDDLVVSSSVDVDAYLHTLKAEGEAVAEAELCTRSGQVVEEEISSRLFTVSGEPTVIMIGRNISRRKAYEEALLTAKEESEQLADLRASFLANMSHEIRTPLTSIIGVSQLLEKRELTDKQAQMVRLIRTSGKRLQQTLDSVLDISRIEAGEMEPQYRRLDVVEQIGDDVELLQPLARQQGIDLRFQCPVEELWFISDPGFLNRIVYNLVENGIKFTDEGGVTVELAPGDGEISLVVNDTGIGIEEKFLPHLFDKFKQASSGTSRSYEGSGLGMSLVRHLVDLLGGSIEVESKRHEGTTFTVRLPEQEIDDPSDDNRPTNSGQTT